MYIGYIPDHCVSTHRAVYIGYIPDHCVSTHRAVYIGYIPDQMGLVKEIFTDLSSDMTRILKTPAKLANRLFLPELQSQIDLLSFESLSTAKNLIRPVSPFSDHDPGESTHSFNKPPTPTSRLPLPHSSPAHQSL